MNLTEFEKKLRLTYFEVKSATIKGDDVVVEVKHKDDRYNRKLTYSLIDIMEGLYQYGMVQDHSDDLKTVYDDTVSDVEDSNIDTQDYINQDVQMIRWAVTWIVRKALGEVINNVPSKVLKIAA